MDIQGADMETQVWLVLVRSVGRLRYTLSSYIWTTNSCFNAFSRVDVRVDVKIPGGVQAYVVDLRGERCARLFRLRMLNLSLAQARSDAGNMARDFPVCSLACYPLLRRSSLLS